MMARRLPLARATALAVITGLTLSGCLVLSPDAGSDRGADAPSSGTPLTEAEDAAARQLATIYEPVTQANVRFLRTLNRLDRTDSREARDDAYDALLNLTTQMAMTVSALKDADWPQSRQRAVDRLTEWLEDTHAVLFAIAVARTPDEVEEATDDFGFDSEVPAEVGEEFGVELLRVPGGSRGAGV